MIKDVKLQCLKKSFYRQEFEDRTMKEFKKYHPFVSFIYFVFVIGFSVFFMHPVCLGISFICGFLYSAVLTGGKSVKLNFRYIIPMMLAATFINAAFNHEGITVLALLPSGTPFTLESLIYGLAAAVMIAAVICWFSCYNEVMTSDKFIYLFGRIMPSLSLIFSMTLRFVPRFVAHFKEVKDAQMCIGCSISEGKTLNRMKNAISALSATLTWAFENSVDTADSMKSRGYGLSGRTSFSVFKFDKRDKSVLIAIILLGGYVLCGKLLGYIDFTYFPTFEARGTMFFSVSVFFAYFMLCIIPIIIEAWEVMKWYFIKSKI